MSITVHQAKQLEEVEKLVLEEEQMNSCSSSRTNKYNYNQLLGQRQRGHGKTIFCKNGDFQNLTNQ